MFKTMFKKKLDEPQYGSAEPPTRQERAKSAPQVFAPGSQIQYHPDLIERFEGQHASLRKIFEAIKTHATEDEFKQAEKSLLAFRRAITSHLLEENIKLYSYLSKCLADDPDNRDLMRSMKSEMGKIGAEVTRFINEYINTGITPFNKQQFLAELDDVGAILVDRMDREETSLYTMYMPPASFK